MSIVDIILLVILGFGAYNGFKKGFIIELLSLFAFILAIIGGFYLMHLGVSFLERAFDLSGSYLPFLSFVLIFVLIIILVNLLGVALKKIIDLTPLGSVDNLAGAALGLLKWAFGLSLVLWLVSYLDLKSVDMLSNSSIAPFIEPIAPKVIGFVGVLVPHFRTLLEGIEEMLKK